MELVLGMFSAMPLCNTAVDARELHLFLESKQDFSNWIKKRIEDCELIEGQDYVTLNKKIERALR
jgi:phage anti-repressor protein